MASDVVLGVWSVVAGGFGAFCAVRYLVRGPWRRRGVARVLRVWEPAAGAGWSNGVPAEIGFVDPGSRRELLGVTKGGGGRAGRLAAAWPGREVVAFGRVRRPDDFRVADQPPPLLDANLSGLGASLILIAASWGARALLGLDNPVGAIGTSSGVVVAVLIAVGVVHGSRAARRRRHLLATPEQVTARVIDVSERRDPAKDLGEKLTTPVLAFSTDDGFDVTVAATYKTATSTLRPGDQVMLRHAAADPSVYAVEDRIALAADASPEAALPEAAPGGGHGGHPLDKTLVWVRADGIRLRADRITAVEVSPDGLLLHAIGRETAARLTVEGPQDAQRLERLERLADELLGLIESPGTPRRAGVLIAFQPAAAHRDAAFTVLPLAAPAPSGRPADQIPTPGPEATV
ncbi:hypothetical protein [Streptomyces sp. CA-111067]|uniref:hypothetical protein n=1 Tax=Streptomyces sp. CA-111067 TaxID=3240046 RepID=UPI003D98175E